MRLLLGSLTVDSSTHSLTRDSLRCADHLSLDWSIPTDNDEWPGSTYDFEYGATFGVGVLAFLIGLVDAIILLILFRRAGDGPCFSRGARPQETPPIKQQYPAGMGSSVGMTGSVQAARAPPLYAA